MKLTAAAVETQSMVDAAATGSSAAKALIFLNSPANGSARTSSRIMRISTKLSRRAFAAKTSGPQ